MEGENYLLANNYNTYLARLLILSASNQRCALLVISSNIFILFFSRRSVEYGFSEQI